MGGSAPGRPPRSLVRLLLALVLALAGVSGLASLPASAAPGASAADRVAAGSNGYGLLIADLTNRRLLITDYHGRILWKWDNPTGDPSASSGPLGVRWMPGGRILATFGTGQVGLIDVATKSFIWEYDGFQGDYFASPYDAQLLSDGNLAVVTRYNEGGRLAVYDLRTGNTVWKVDSRQAHTMLYRSAATSWNTRYPSIIVGGIGRLTEYTYGANMRPRATWSRSTRWSHDVIPAGNGTFLSQDDLYFHRFRHTGQDLWKRDTPDNQRSRRFALDPTDHSVFIMAGGLADNVQFRRLSNGSLIRSFSRLSDGTSLDFPYGIRAVPLSEVPGA